MWTKQTIRRQQLIDRAGYFMPIKFVKTEDKIKKSLAKEFQTFNNKPEEQAEHSPKESEDKAKKSKLSQFKPPKSSANQQFTTQAKSPFINSASGSKAQLAPYHRLESLSGQNSIKQSIKSSKKSLHQSLSKMRPHTPAEQLSRSRQSSPQAQRAYSKMSSYDKRAYSKMSNYKKNQLPEANEHETTYGAKSMSKASFSKGQKDKTKQSTVSKLTNEKAISNKKKQIQNNESENFQINFPQMITESESAYPSSSQPNTGKESSSRGHDDWQQKRNSNITEEQENDVDEPVQEDYISEGEMDGEEMAESLNPSNLMGESGLPFESNEYQSSGYNQLPKSYLMAMQILQAKVTEQQATIRKLKQKAEKQSQNYKDLEIEVNSLQNIIQDQSKVIEQKDAQIKFLKGYLDEEKHNNREALKEVAKNVYERSRSAKKLIQNPYHDSKKSIKKAKKQLFIEEEKQNSQKNQFQFKRKPTIDAKESDNFDIEEGEEKTSQSDGENTQNDSDKEIKYERKPAQRKQKNNQKQPTDLSRKHFNPQIKQQKVHTKPTESKQNSKRPSQTYNEQLSLIQQITREELIKDTLMREKILQEQALKTETDKKYNYLQKSPTNNHLQKSPKNNRSLSVKQAYPYTVKKLQTSGWDSSTRKRPEEGERQLYSDGKRVRSMSTAVKHLQEQTNPNITYRPRNIPTSNTPSFSYHDPPTSILNPSVQSVMDPVLERYLQAKSDISSYRANHETAFFNEGLDLKSDKKHRQAVSEMRELMRGEKQLVALNYRLEAIERRILECVKSAGKDEELTKTVRQQAEEKILLEELQKKYGVLKKEFERKEIAVKQLKVSWEQK